MHDEHDAEKLGALFLTLSKSSAEWLRIESKPEEILKHIVLNIQACLDSNAPFEILQKNIKLLKNQEESSTIQQSIAEFQTKKTAEVLKITQLLKPNNEISEISEKLKNTAQAIIQTQELLREQTVFIASQNDRLAELSPVLALQSPSLFQRVRNFILSTTATTPTTVDTLFEDMTQSITGFQGDDQKIPTNNSPENTAILDFISECRTIWDNNQPQTALAEETLTRILKELTSQDSSPNIPLLRSRLYALYPSDVLFEHIVKSVNILVATDSSTNAGIIRDRLMAHQKAMENAKKTIQEDDENASNKEKILEYNELLPDVLHILDDIHAGYSLQDIADRLTSSTRINNSQPSGQLAASISESSAQQITGIVGTTELENERNKLTQERNEQSIQVSLDLINKISEEIIPKKDSYDKNLLKSYYGTMEENIKNIESINDTLQQLKTEEEELLSNSENPEEKTERIQKLLSTRKKTITTSKEQLTVIQRAFTLARKNLNLAQTNNNRVKELTLQTAKIQEKKQEKAQKRTGESFTEHAKDSRNMTIVKAFLTEKDQLEREKNNPAEFYKSQLETLAQQDNPEARRKLITSTMGIYTKELESLQDSILFTQKIEELTTLKESLESIPKNIPEPQKTSTQTAIAKIQQIKKTLQTEMSTAQKEANAIQERFDNEGTESQALIDDVAATANLLVQYDKALTTAEEDCKKELQTVLEAQDEALSTTIQETEKLQEKASKYLEMLEKKDNYSKEAFSAYTTRVQPVQASIATIQQTLREQEQEQEQKAKKLTLINPQSSAKDITAQIMTTSQLLLDVQSTNQTAPEQIEKAHKVLTTAKTDLDAQQETINQGIDELTRQKELLQDITPYTNKIAELKAQKKVLEENLSAAQAALTKETDSSVLEKYKEKITQAIEQIEKKQETLVQEQEQAKIEDQAIQEILTDQTTITSAVLQAHQQYTRKLIASIPTLDKEPPALPNDFLLEELQKILTQRLQALQGIQPAEQPGNPPSFPTPDVPQTFQDGIHQIKDINQRIAELSAEKDVRATVSRASLRQKRNSESAIRASRSADEKRKNENEFNAKVALYIGALTEDKQSIQKQLGKLNDAPRKDKEAIRNKQGLAEIIQGQLDTLNSAKSTRPKKQDIITQYEATLEADLKNMQIATKNLPSETAISDEEEALRQSLQKIQPSKLTDFIAQRTAFRALSKKVQQLSHAAKNRALQTELSEKSTITEKIIALEEHETTLSEKKYQAGNDLQKYPKELKQYTTSVTQSLKKITKAIGQLQDQIHKENDPKSSPQDLLTSRRELLERLAQHPQEILPPYDEFLRQDLTTTLQEKQAALRDIVAKNKEFQEKIAATMESHQPQSANYNPDLLSVYNQEKQRLLEQIKPIQSELTQQSQKAESLLVSSLTQPTLILLEQKATISELLLNNKKTQKETESMIQTIQEALTNSNQDLEKEQKKLLDALEKQSTTTDAPTTQNPTKVLKASTTPPIARDLIAASKAMLIGLQKNLELESPYMLILKELQEINATNTRTFSEIPGKDITPAYQQYIKTLNDQISTEIKTIQEELHTASEKEKKITTQITDLPTNNTPNGADLAKLIEEAESLITARGIVAGKTTHEYLNKYTALSQEEFQTYGTRAKAYAKYREELRDNYKTKISKYFLGRPLISHNSKPEIRETKKADGKISTLTADTLKNRAGSSLVLQMFKSMPPEEFMLHQTGKERLTFTVNSSNTKKTKDLRKDIYFEYIALGIAHPPIIKSKASIPSENWIKLLENVMKEAFSQPTPPPTAGKEQELGFARENIKKFNEILDARKPTTEIPKKDIQKAKQKMESMRKAWEKEIEAEHPKKTKKSTQVTPPTQ